MSIDKEEKMNKIIIMFEKEDIEIDMSLYDFISNQYRNGVSMLVCNVTEEEYKEMQRQVKIGSLRERSTRMMNNKEIGYNRFKYLLKYNNNSNQIYISDYSNPEKRGSYTLDSEGIHYDEEGYQFSKSFMQKIEKCRLKVYTTETYNDVIKHYSVNLDKKYEIKEKKEELIKLLGRNCRTCTTGCPGRLGGAGCANWSHTIR